MYVISCVLMFFLKKFRRFRNSAFLEDTFWSVKIEESRNDND